MGQAWAQRPQPVHTQGNFDSTTSSTMPKCSIRRTFLVSQPSIPGVPVTGQPLLQVPQVMHRFRLNFAGPLGSAPVVFAVLRQLA